MPTPIITEEEYDEEDEADEDVDEEETDATTKRSYPAYKGAVFFGVLFLALLWYAFSYSDQITQEIKSWWPFGEETEEFVGTPQGIERQVRQTHSGMGDNVAGDKVVQECKLVSARVLVLELGGAVNGIFQGKGRIIEPAPDAGKELPIAIDIPLRVGDIIRVCQFFVVE